MRRPRTPPGTPSAPGPVGVAVVEPARPQAEATHQDESPAAATVPAPWLREATTVDGIEPYARRMAGRVTRATNGRIDRATNRPRRRRPPAVVPDNLTSPLDRDAVEPLHRQIERRLRDAIAEGRLRPGARLTATRSLAGELLGVARITVQTAYDQLAAEGYLDVDARRGTRVATDLPEQGFAMPRSGADDAGPVDRYPARNPWAPDEPITLARDPRSPPRRSSGRSGSGSTPSTARGWERLLVRAWRELSSEPDSDRRDLRRTAR